MNTTANTIKLNANNDANKAMTLADEICSGNQDWENELTTWEFEDGSKLTVNSFGDITAE